MKLRAILATLGLLTLWWLTWPWPFAAARGQLAARLDLGMGKYTMVVYGLPAPWGQDYYGLLSQRYGIQIQRVAYCIVSPSLVTYTDEFDKISSAAAIWKYGRNIFQECADEARKNWERKAAEKKLTH